MNPRKVNMPMYPLSAVEKSRLDTCDKRLQSIVLKVLDRWNIVVITGHRDKAGQDKALAGGNTKLAWPRSKHNTTPSRAVDMVPVEIKNKREVIDWNDRERMHLFAGYVLAVADQLGIRLRWGGDWDNDSEVKDNVFDDLVHFELID